MSNELWIDPTTGRRQPYKIVGGAAKPTYHDEDVYEHIRTPRAQRAPTSYDRHMVDRQRNERPLTDEDISVAIDAMLERAPSSGRRASIPMAPSGEPGMTRRSSRLGRVFVYTDEG